MSAMERVTGADWAAWLRHIVGASVRGAAMSVKASGSMGAASVLSTEMWAPTVVDIQLLGYTAAVGFLFAFCDALSEMPVPTGKEVDETASK